MKNMTLDEIRAIARQAVGGGPRAHASPAAMSTPVRRAPPNEILNTLLDEQSAALDAPALDQARQHIMQAQKAAFALQKIIDRG